MPISESDIRRALVDGLRARGITWNDKMIRRRAHALFAARTPVAQVGRILDMLADPTPGAACRNIERRAGRSQDDMDAAIRLGLVTA
jgi:hypothetical protein